MERFFCLLQYASENQIRFGALFEKKAQGTYMAVGWLLVPIFDILLFISRQQIELEFCATAQNAYFFNLYNLKVALKWFSGF